MKFKGDTSEASEDIARKLGQGADVMYCRGQQLAPTICQIMRHLNKICYSFSLSTRQ